MRLIGDVVFTTPAIRALRGRFPDAHLAYVVEPAAEPVVRGNPHLNEVIVAPREHGVAGLGADAALVRRLRAGRYDLAIDFHGGPRSSLLTWLSGAPDRLGYEVAGRAWMYTARVPRPRERRERHSVENQWDLLEPLGIPRPDPATHPVEMTVDPEAAASVGARLAQAAIAFSDPVVVLHVSAGNPFRRWPLSSFTALVETLAAGSSRWIIVTSGPSERDAAARVIADARAHLGETEGGRVLSCGEFSLAELRALLERAALYIGGDSGPLHVAATTRVPIVGLYGPTLSVRSAPWRDPTLTTESVDAGALPCRPCDQRVCEPGDFRCLAAITPGQVAAAAERALERAAHAADKMSVR